MGKRMRWSLAACVSVVAVSLVLAGSSGRRSVRWVCDDGGGNDCVFAFDRGRSSRGRCLPG